MKKLITILISCSLALAASAMAQQQEDAQQSPPKAQKGKAHAAKPADSNAKPNAERPAAKSRPAGKQAQESAPAAEKANAPTSEKAAVNTRAQKKERNASKANAAKANAKTNEPAASAPAQAKSAPAQPKSAPAQAKAESQAPAAPQANQPNAGAHRVAAPKKQPDPQAIKAQHVNFHAQPKPAQVPAVTFRQNIRIEGSEHWQGERYSAFRSYHPEMHDERFYHSHYSRVELIGGGYYYYNGGYWYPAWGYRPTAQYYAYDGPIYAGAHAEPPDKVIADVQASLSDQGYYTGEVDGLLGPLTRQALTGYQSDNGLYATAAIDQPTLASLGMD